MRKIKLIEIPIKNSLMNLDEIIIRIIKKRFLNKRKSILILIKKKKPLMIKFIVRKIRINYESKNKNGQKIL
jgi:hypothetical protein